MGLALEQSTLNGRKDVQAARGRPRLSGPVLVALLFAALGIGLSVAGLWRDHNLSLRNIVLAVFFGGFVWGLISWAIATAVVHVEEDVASGEDEDA